MDFLYIDPGTGSMLFSLVMGISIVVSFAIKSFILKIKFIFSGGKVKENGGDSSPYVIFSDHKRYWNVFGPICDEFEKRKLPLVYYTQSSDDPALSKKYEYVKPEFIGEGNKGLAKMNFLKADICLSTTPGLDVLQWKRSKECKWYVHVPHSLDDMMGYRMFGLDFYDSVLLTGDFQGDYIRRLEKMRNENKKELVTVGYPPMDMQKIRLENSPCISDEKIILVAPSWGPSAILSKFGKKFLKAVTDTGYKVIVRPHPQSLSSEKEMIDSLMKDFPDSENFQWNFDNDNFECMNKASILITDFSGIIFDFALLFDKPVIYADTEFDPSIYDASWFENETLWRFEILKQIGIKLEESQFVSMKEVIKKALVDSSLQEGREKARNQAWMHPGESVERTVNYMINKREEIISIKR